MGTIYIVRNTENDKVYIGQTSGDLGERFRHHKSSVGTDRKGHMPLYVAMERIGIERFYIEPLEENVPNEELYEKEAEYIQKYNSNKYGYNSRAGSKGGKMFTKADVASIVERSKKGDTARDIAKEYGVSYATVLRTLHNEGIWAIETDYNRIISLFQSGLTYGEIADIMGIDSATVARHLHKNGIRRRKAYMSKRNDFDYVAFSKDYEQQMPIADICKKYNITKTTFYRIKDKLGIKNRPQVYSTGTIRYKANGRDK